jgi:class 3 adenylate cyclase/tetratricopeptide (TPR) repeat protein
MTCPDHPRSVRQRKRAGARPVEPDVFLEHWLRERVGFAERRQVAVLACDIVGAEGLLLQLDAEDAAELVARYRQALAAVVADYGGALAPGASTDLLATWGYPRAVADGAVRAIDAALALIGTIGAELQVQCAIDAGIAVVRPTAEAAASSMPEIIGPVIGWAPRLRRLAPANGVLISETMRTLVAGAFDLERANITDLRQGRAIACWHVQARAAGDVGDGDLFPAWLGEAPSVLRAQHEAELDALGALKALAQATAVAGSPFASALLAAILDMDERRLMPALEALVGKGVLERVKSAGERVGRYAFQCRQMQETAHASLLGSRRSDLHRRCAEALSGRLADLARSDPATVARHFEEAGDGEGAFLWWRRAAERANEHASPLVAVARLERALSACDGSGQGEIAALSALGLQLAALKGNAAADVLEIFRRCLSLAAARPDVHVDFDALWALEACYLVRGDIDMALRIGACLMVAAERDGADDKLLRVHRVQGLALLLRGELSVAREHLRTAVALYDEARHGALRFHYTSDQGALALAHLAWAETVAGERTAAEDRARSALKLAGRLRHPHTSAHVLCVLAARSQTQGDRPTATALATAGRTLGQRHAFPYWTAWADIILGWAEGVRRPLQGMGRITAAIAAYRETGAEQALPYAYLLLAETALGAGDRQQARDAIDTAETVTGRHGPRLYAAEILRRRAEIESGLGAPWGAASAHLTTAREMALQQGAGLFVPRIETSLGALSPSRREASGLATGRPFAMEPLDCGAHENSSSSR